MEKYKFKSANSDSDLVINDYVRAYKACRHLQSVYNIMERTDVPRVCSLLNEIKADQYWRFFPEDKPAGNAHRLIEIVTGQPAEDFIKAFKVLSPEGFRDISWIEEDFAKSAPKTLKKDVQEIKTQDPTLTQQEIADQVGVSQGRVAQILLEKTVRTEKTNNPKRVKLRYEITSYTKPETAAQKIIDIFGEEFAKNLATHLSK
jgi:predicted XRE-type DNA-binding protein